MNKVLIILFLCGILNAFSIPFSSAQKNKKSVKLLNNVDSVSYAIGLDIGNTLKVQGFEINKDALKEGLIAGISGEAALFDDVMKQKVLLAFQQQLQAKMIKEREDKSEKLKLAGIKFLEENAKKPGVKTTPSGLQYKVLVEGKGVQPTINDKVTVNYWGKLIDGTEFDNSYKRGEPATFPLNAVIKGWTEGLQLMKEGGTYELYIPSELGYGDRGAGDDIPPGAVLIFQVELIKVNPTE